MPKFEKLLIDTFQDHCFHHEDSFESLIITFQEDGTWFLTGIGGKAFASMKTVSDVLGEAAQLVGEDQETLH